ncbi:hypothetical protein [Bradyrhizobium algeriense]|uniref:hypothetical protein n=1 Tax=Bradyrhizobium algeriense TaxID=634784 RepID=UPI003A842A65
MVCTVHETVGHLGIFVSGARAGGEPRRHPQIASARRRRAACRPGGNSGRAVRERGNIRRSSQAARSRD